jgi:hypothetical protein
VLKKILIGVAILAAGLALVTWSAMSRQQIKCEVCITFNGNTECRKVQGANRDEAVRAGADTACASLASGMSEVIKCPNTPPTRVTCESL